jgi:peptide deformylase
MIDIEKCKITHYPTPVLAEPARPVENIDENIRQLVAKMADIMRQHSGLGLAAPQAGVPLRLFIIALDPEKKDIKVFINPTVKPTGTLDSIEEGCLSVPGVYTKIKRYTKCRVTATDLDRKEFSEEAEGLYARALQHEYDHIEGITIVNRMGQAAKIAHRKQIKKLKDSHNKSLEQ